MYKSFYCNTQVFVPDYICRHKAKMPFCVFRHKSLNISYTTKNLILSGSQLCVPMAALTYICGQRCTVILSRVSVSSWKLRKNTVIGCRVTLRGKMAQMFCEKLYLYGCFPYKDNSPQGYPDVCDTINFGVPFAHFFEYRFARKIYTLQDSGFYIDISIPQKTPLVKKRVHP